MRTFAASIVAVVLAASGSVHSNAQGVDDQRLNRPQWRSVVHSSAVQTNEIFPSVVLALSSRPSRPSSPSYLGDSNGVLGVQIVSPWANARARVSIKVDQFAENSVLEVNLPVAGRTYEVWPKLRFDSRALAAVREPIPTTALFSVSIDGGAAQEQVRSLRIRSVNDVPYAYVTTTGQVQNVGYMFAAFVNENSPVIDRILREALDANAVQSFAGYQGPPASVMREVFAVWNVLQRHGVKYSSIAQPSAQSQTVFSQHLRFLDEVVDNAQANCADGSLLFASVLYKLGIHPALVIVPQHMFVGWFVDRDHRQSVFLETTLVGARPLNSFQRSWTFQTADGYLSSASYQQFQEAVQVGSQRFQQAIPHLQAKAPHYALIDVDAARKAGISAIPRF
jgi:hypothetical protein